MSQVSLKDLDVDQLLALRDEVDARINAMAKDEINQLTSRLNKLQAVAGVKAPAGTRTKGPRKGAKVDPKYRDPKTGDTWTGRGLKPNWLKARLEAGKKLEDFLIK